MIKMHDNEQEVNATLVQSLLKAMPSMGRFSELNPILSSGTDNAFYP